MLSVSPSIACPAPETSFLLLPACLEVHGYFGTLLAGPGPELPNLTEHEAWKSLIIF